MTSPVSMCFFNPRVDEAGQPIAEEPTVQRIALALQDIHTDFICIRNVGECANELESRLENGVWPAAFRRNNDTFFLVNTDRFKVLDFLSTAMSCEGQNTSEVSRGGKFILLDKAANKVAVVAMAVLDYKSFNITEDTHACCMLDRLGTRKWLKLKKDVERAEEAHPELKFPEPRKFDWARNITSDLRYSELRKRFRQEEDKEPEPTEQKGNYRKSKLFRRRHKKKKREDKTENSSQPVKWKPMPSQALDFSVLICHVSQDHLGSESHTLDKGGRFSYFRQDEGRVSINSRRLYSIEEYEPQS